MIRRSCASSPVARRSVLCAFMLSSFAGVFVGPCLAQAADQCAGEEDVERREQCKSAYAGRANQMNEARPPVSQPGSVMPTLPPPPGAVGATPPVVNARPNAYVERTREGCGAVLAHQSGAPGARGVVVIAARRRQPVERELEMPGAPAVDINAVEPDLCFEAIGGFVVARPPARQTGFPLFTLGEDSVLDDWLVQVARGNAGRLQLPAAERCTDLLRDLQGRGLSPPYAWVTDGDGIARCEFVGGQTRTDPVKTNGYDGVVVLEAKE